MIGFILAVIFLCIAFVSMIFVVFSFSNLLFLLSLVLLLGTGLFSILTLIAVFKGGRWGWSFLIPVTLVLLLFSLGTYSITQTIGLPLLVLIVFSMLTFGLSIAALHAPRRPKNTRSPPLQFPEKIEPQKSHKKKKTAKKK